MMQKEPVKVLTLVNKDTKSEDKYAISSAAIGTGTFSKVYKAVHMENPNMVFAVKIIPLVSESARKQYLQELDIVQHLPKCPNIVHIHKQHLESDNNLYIFQQYCESGTFIDYHAAKNGEPYTEDEIYNIFFQTCNGLINLLDAGIVHEDIKPANILCKGPLFKLCDFGLSKLQSRSEVSKQRCGTLSHMPPEKLTKSFVPNEKSDIYSLGVCLYEHFFGIHPYLGSDNRPNNYQEYKKRLEKAELLPTSKMIKKVQRCSLKFQVFVKFLEKMIERKAQHRASLNDLKTFLATTEPFCHYSIPEELEISTTEKARPSFANRFDVLQESVIMLRNNDRSLAYCPQEQLPQTMPCSTRAIQKDDYFQKERQFICSVTSYLFRGMQYLRKSNFEHMATKPFRKIDQLKTDLSHCSEIRIIKFLTLHYISDMMSHLKEKYSGKISQEQDHLVSADAEYLRNELFKYMIDIHFEGLKQLCNELKDPEMFQSVGNILADYFNIIEKDVQVIVSKKQSLLGMLFLKGVTRVIHAIETITQTGITIEQVSTFFSSSQHGRVEAILEQFNEYQMLRVQVLMKKVQQQIDRQKGIVFQLVEDNDEYEILVDDNQLLPQ